MIQIAQARNDTRLESRFTQGRRKIDGKIREEEVKEVKSERSLKKRLARCGLPVLIWRLIFARLVHIWIC